MGISVAPDLADVPAVARGHQRTAEECECEGDEKIERGEHHRTPEAGSSVRHCTDGAAITGRARGGDIGPKKFGISAMQEGRADVERS